MKDPVDHILRPQLPWRDDPGMTECGYDASKVQTLTRDQYRDRVKDMGRQRSAMMTCMTCSGTFERWARWEDDPRRCMGREIEWECGSSYYRNADRGWRLHDELLAIASIIAEHREVFEGLVAEAHRRREWLKQKADHEKAKAQKTVTQLKPR